MTDEIRPASDQPGPAGGARHPVEQLLGRTLRSSSAGDGAHAAPLRTVDAASHKTPTPWGHTARRVDAFTGDLAGAVDEFLAAVRPGDMVWTVAGEVTDLLRRRGMTIPAHRIADDLGVLLLAALREAQRRRDLDSECDAHAAALSGRAGADDEPVHGLAGEPRGLDHRLHLVFPARALSGVSRDSRTAQVIGELTDPRLRLVLHPLLPPLAVT